ncbi:Crp/Fnr family transcriptional regulator [Roseivirga pacifica]
MQREIKYWYLRNYDLFTQLTKEQVNDLCKTARFLRMKKGQTIYFANQDKKRMYFLINGKCKISEIDRMGNEMIKDIVLTGDLFGNLSGGGYGLTQEYAEVLSSEVIICMYEMPDFEMLMQKYPSLSYAFSQKMSDKLKRMEQRYANLVFKDVKERLKAFLHDWAQREGKSDVEGTVIRNYLTHQEIASLISSSRQTVTTLINELKLEGKVQYSRSRIVIPDVRRLAA